LAKKKKKNEETGLEPGADFVPTRLRPIDIQQKAFSTSMRGYYHPEEVDEFLDRLTEDYAAVVDENKRLREGGIIPTEGSGDAEATIRQARAEADDIIRQARAKAAAASGGDSMGAVWPFLAQEREFLRSLAAMVQDHAEGIKRQVREVQEESKAEPAASPGTPPTRTAPSTSSTGQKAQSAWTATAATPAPSTSDRPSVVIPPSPVDTPSQKPVEDEPSEDKPAEPPQASTDKGSEEPSLRELFWGDED
jgi:DivIVA domain-containing protein